MFLCLFLCVLSVCVCVRMFVCVCVSLFVSVCVVLFCCYRTFILYGIIFSRGKIENIWSDCSLVFYASKGCLNFMFGLRISFSSSEIHVTIFVIFLHIYNVRCYASCHRHGCDGLTDSRYVVCPNCESFQFFIGMTRESLQCPW